MEDEEEEDEEGGGRGLTALAGGSVPARGADAAVPADLVDAGSSLQTGGALTVVDVCNEASFYSYI